MSKTVKVSRSEVRRFKRQWPASGIPDGVYVFVFDGRGDLVDMDGPEGHREVQSGALAAMSDDAQAGEIGTVVAPA